MQCFVLTVVNDAAIVHLLFSIINFTIALKFGVPQPLGTSHPTRAGNPGVLHPADEPLTTSVNALWPFW